MGETLGSAVRHVKKENKAEVTGKEEKNEADPI